jgi:hypothetical protein
MPASLGSFPAAPRITPFLGIHDLCSLDVVSKAIAHDLANASGQGHAWLIAAENAGVSISDMDRRSIKAMLFAMTELDLDLDVETIPVHTDKRAESFTTAVIWARKMKLKHLQSGSKIGKTFIARFSFKPEDIVSYREDPSKAISSFPISTSLGGMYLNIDLVLTWRAGSMLLSVSEISTRSELKPCKPFSVNMRSVFSPLIMMKDFRIEASTLKEGTGLCWLSQSPSDFADSLMCGIVCVGVVYDHDHNLYNSSRHVGALQIDRPGWKVESELQMDSRLQACEWH